MIIETYNKKEIIEIIKREVDKKLEFVYEQLRKLRERDADLENIIKKLKERR